LSVRLDSKDAVPEDEEGPEEGVSELSVPEGLERAAVELDDCEDGDGCCP
jgi:hypothetical protein